MAAIFTPTANLAWKLTLLAFAAIFLGAMGWWWLWPRMDYVRHVRATIHQPVPFSHQHHVAGLGIDCRFCHTSVEVSSSAGLPPTYTCMTCHSQIWTNAALLAPVRESLGNRQADFLASRDRSSGLRLFQSQHPHRQGRGVRKLPWPSRYDAAYLQGKDTDHAILPRLSS